MATRLNTGAPLCYPSPKGERGLTAVPHHVNLFLRPGFEYENPVTILPSAPTGRLTVIGNFDGVHLGHQAMLTDAMRFADERGLSLLILTFHPHPAKVLRNIDVPALTALSRKCELIVKTAPSAFVHVETFDLAWAEQTPEMFARDILAQRLNSRVVIVGSNFCFGKNRAGNFGTLSELGLRYGFETRSHPMVGDPAGPWSSSRAREAILSGQAEEAARILGRPHMLSGEVILGHQRGRTIGFPTCNLGRVPEALPAFGVYSVLVDRGHPNNGHPRFQALAQGVANIGLRPTLGESEPKPTVEVHLFDTQGDFYGAELRVHIIHRLREEKKFPSFSELKAQIQRDAEQAREQLKPFAIPADRSAWG